MKRSRLWSTVLAVLLLVPASSVHAEYQRDAYGSGIYGDSSTSSSSGSSTTNNSSSGAASTGSGGSGSSVLTTDSGLEVSINLVDGQVIPVSYTIIITPLNGQGKTFDKADIYMDGKLVFSGAPQSNGTLTWKWDTGTYPASKVKIVISGPGDTVKSHEFSVSMAPVEASNTTSDTSSQQPAENAPGASSGLSWWVWAIIIGGVLLVLGILLVSWRRHKSPPPYTPMQLS